MIISNLSKSNPFSNLELLSELHNKNNTCKHSEKSFNISEEGSNISDASTIKENIRLTEVSPLKGRNLNANKIQQPAQFNKNDFST